MSNKKQSSIEWLEEQIKDIFYVAEASEMNKKFKSVYEQAKAMHKEEIEDAWLNGTRGQMIAPFGINRYKPEAEQYYNETF
jgi:hypothetical protein